MMRTTKLILFLLAVAMLTIPSATPAQIAVGIAVHIGPPALPVYAQPICPGPGYMWTPGYWAWGPDGYFWVPGTWVVAPAVGLLWTPGYWGWGGAAYFWHAGYWGPHVGFYGGINYGYGYGGVGFYGGEWRGGAYHYNTAVTNVNTTVIHNTYVNNTVINNNTTVNRVSYNGGTGGVAVQPTAGERAAAEERHVAATSTQTQHEQMARNDRTMLASANHGQPAVAATVRPGLFHGEGVVAARNVNTNANRYGSTTFNNGNAAHTDRPPSVRTNNSVNSGPTYTKSNTNTATNPNRPPNASTQTYHPNGSTSNTNHPNTEHPTTNHPSSQPKPQSHPSEPHEHPGSGHPGGHGR